MGRSDPSAGARRADAVRNVERILDAATACLVGRPTATMAEIAQAAGLGRVTLYGHFASRAELVDAVTARVLGQNDRALAAVDLSGDPRTALARLLHGTWQLLDRSRSVVLAAEQELTPERIWELHAGMAARMEELVERGREQGVFRVDLPVSWLLTVLHQVVHGAAQEIAAGRLDPERAPELICTTALAVFTPPAT